MATVIDLNCDLGEGFGTYEMGADEALLPLVSSANIACGFHAGDASIMRRRCDEAVRLGVRIGAHIGYRDLAGFGRRAMAVPAAVVRDEAVYQIGALDAFARAAGDRVRYVKPHGALYHAATDDDDVAGAVVEALRAFPGRLTLLGPDGSAMQRLARAAGMAYATEGFIDRSYTAAGRLTPRGQPDAHLSGPAALEQALSIATMQSVAALDGTRVAVSADSLCVHSDVPGAVERAREVRAVLERAGVTVRAFT